MHPSQAYLQVPRPARIKNTSHVSPPTQLTSNETLTVTARPSTHWVSDGDEAGAVEEAVPRVPAPGLVVGVHGHRRPRQEAFVWPGAAASALDGATVALGAGELQVKKVDSYSCCC